VKENSKISRLSNCRRFSIVSKNWWPIIHNNPNWRFWLYSRWWNYQGCQIDHEGVVFNWWKPDEQVSYNSRCHCKEIF